MNNTNISPARPLPPGAVLDTWDPGVSHSFTLPDLFALIPGDPDPAPAGRLPRQHRERPVTCLHRACQAVTWRADAHCHEHAGDQDG